MRKTIIFILAPANGKTKSLFSLFIVSLAVSALLGILLQWSGILERLELQTINRRFEARPWLAWKPESIQRLNPMILWDYHEHHEMPRLPWSWDYTLSWLLENNHPPVHDRIVIFNHLFEDEPPPEAVLHFPWMEPLLRFPLGRDTYARMVEFLAKAGAKAIVIDNDFPQFGEGDAELAQVIYNCAHGAYGRVVPVFMVRTVNRRSAGPMLQLEIPTSPSGVLTELQRLEPGINVLDKYTGVTCIDQDKDQVVRRIYLRVNSGSPFSSETFESVLAKLLKATSRRLPAAAPQLMDIDFSAPPNSDLYPVRPLSYLLDPQQQALLLNEYRHGHNHDVVVKDAIVFIGDGITDVYATPLTNEGFNQMSGTEILAHSLETLSRQSWPRRLEDGGSYLYVVLAGLCGSFIWLLWKLFLYYQGFDVVNSTRGRLVALLGDTTIFVFILMSTYVVACAIFAGCGLIVPIMNPMVSIGIGLLAAIVWEREREREEKFALKLFAAQEKLELTREKYEAELKQQEAEALNREILMDRKRRYEFVRRINHDLNGPVSVLNWTVSEMQLMEPDAVAVRDKVGRLVKASDKLGELLDQLVSSYDYDTVPDERNHEASLCDLSVVLDDCLDGQRPLAEKCNAVLIWHRPASSHFVRGNALDLARVFDNIIRNAIKHNPSGTEITVDLSSNGSFHTISIADTGRGIAETHVRNIFQPGYRVNPNGTKGHGLGLDIAKTLIENMSGEISVDSVVGEGTIFRIRLPVDLSSIAEMPPDKHGAPATIDSSSEEEIDEEKNIQATLNQAREIVRQGTGD